MQLKKVRVTLSLLFLLAGALFLWADGGAQHQSQQSPPILLGTTGGNVNDITAFCCSGTLGSLISIGGTDYILSNNHVLARTNLASPGEAIIHPGLIDQSPVCAQDLNDTVATLTRFVPISFARGTVNKVDAAIAQPSVSISSSILDVGTVGSGAVAATIGQAVQKSGRTTGLTHGTVSMVNVTLDVGYNKECNKGRQVARFEGQIGIGPGSFSDGGDSGSLIVEDIASSPGRVGLLFAGSSTLTFANPYADVVAAFTSGDGGGGGGGGNGNGNGPPPGRGKPNVVSDAAVGLATVIKERHQARLLQVPGVVGLGVGASTRPGDAAIVVLLRADSAEARRAIPPALEGIPVRIEVTGDVVARSAFCSLN